MGLSDSRLGQGVAVIYSRLRRDLVLFPRSIRCRVSQVPGVPLVRRAALFYPGESRHCI